MKLRLVLVVCAAAISLAAPLSAHLPEYSPFTPASRPKQFPVRELAELRSEDTRYLDFVEKGRSRPSRNPILRITWTYDKAGLDAGIALTMLSWDGKRITNPFHVSFSPVIPHGYSADLNYDGRLDYVLIVYLGGNGAIGGGSNHVVFAISEGTTYRIFMTACLYPGTNDFLDINNDGSFQFLQMSFVPTGPVRGKDGKSHNYWIYNLYKVEGSELKLDNSLLNGFPIWILYTFRANHTETD